ncbi:MAG TPA: pilus assembly protein N-terminal domain-containing protein [Terricaulis sp.]|nr:pilus assembly protein N-terminal domain-containing protein [Terricaulis sp.]HRP10101.1 pilus assembly protein N-terminal domain-containing protein [Terricaulis sp.]
MRAWMQKAAKLIVAAAAVSAALASPASARDIRVALDQAFPIRLSEAAEGVAIGNPSIAGVSVQNERFLFVTGRSYGSTNLVVIGQGGRVLYSGRIQVIPDETDVVVVTRAGETSRLECAPVCRPRPDIGDSAATSATLQGQIASRGPTR